MFKLDSDSPTPLYLQIVTEAKRAYNQGYLADGDQLPSIREMAKILLVNQSTVSKAYKELESQGIIKTVTGKGSFISIDKEKLEEEKILFIEKLKIVFKEALAFGITSQELADIYEETTKEESHDS